MIQSILLALTAIIVMVDVLVGLHRGLRFGVLRLVIWAIGTVLAFLLARSVTVLVVLKWAGVSDMKAYTHNTFGDWLGRHTDTIGTHLTGLEISFLVPVVFVALFIVTKFITWIIYLIVRKLIKRAAKKATAHNAAVDAVTEVKKVEIAAEVSSELEQPFEPGLPKASYNAENGDDFGTFGIYPKEEPKAETVAESAAPAAEEPQEEKITEVQAEQVDAFEQISEEIPAAAAEIVEEPESESSEAFEDGFESLARASMEEEQREALKKQSKPKKPKKARPEKIKPARKEKELKKKHSLALLLVKNPKQLSVGGGILGFFTGIFACAIIASPITGVARAIAESEKAEDTVSAVMALSVMDKKQLSDDMFQKSEKPMNDIPRDVKFVGDLSFRPDDFVDILSSVDDSAIHYVYTYTGASFVSSFIYDGLCKVNTESVGLDNKGNDSYRLPDTIICYKEMITDLNNLVNAINSGNGLSTELVDILQDSMNHIFSISGEGAVLTDADKTALANGLVDRFNEYLSRYTETIPGITLFEGFSNVKEAEEGMNNVFDMIRELVNAGVFE